MKHGNLIFLIIFLIIIFIASISTITYKVNDELSKDTLKKNELDIILQSIIIGMTILATISLIIINYIYSITSFESSVISYINSIITIILGILSAISSGISWDFFGRNSTGSKRNIAILLTILTILLLFAVEIKK